MHPDAPTASVWRTRFERHPWSTTVALFLVGLLLVLATMEAGLRWYGVGNPLLYETSPLWGFRPRPNQTVRRYDGNIVHTNNLGLRSNADWDSAAANKILFLGNSVTFGSAYVSNEDLFSERVIGPANGWIPGNAGVNGWGVENIYGLIAGAHFHPARVYVSVLIEDDFYRGLATKSWILRETKPPLALQAGFPTAVARLRGRFNRYDTTDTTTNDSLARRAVGRLAALDTLLRQRGAIHLIYLSPYLSNLNGGQPPDARLATLLSAAGLHVMRLGDRPRLRALSPSERVNLFHDDVHLSKAGHLMWSTLIRPDLDSALARRQ